MLLEEGFTVTSVDASDKMLKQAHKTRWARRKEDKFDEWGMHRFIWILVDFWYDFLWIWMFQIFKPNIYHLVIDEANWLHLEDDLNKEGHIPKDGGFDALICMGNSFAHLPDFEGNQREHEMAINNFYKLLKPGGILMIDHRNYDYILDHGQAPSKNIYYNVSKQKTILCFKL